MRDLNTDNQERLLTLLKRCMPMETTDATLYRMVLSFVQRRNANPDRVLFDLHVNERLRAIEENTGPSTNPQEIIDSLVDLHDAVATFPKPT